MAKILLVFGTTEGHTAQIAQRMAEAIRASGHEVDVHDSKAVRESRIDGDYAGVLVGGSVHVGEHQSSVREFVRHNRALLERVPSVFFSVSLTAAEPDEEARQETQAMIDKFVRETGWRPTRTEAIAGALVYSQYNVFIRQIMKLIARRAGHSTDTAQDYDFTDWNAVERFARDFAASVDAAARIGAGT